MTGRRAVKDKAAAKRAEPHHPGLEDAVLAPAAPADAWDAPRYVAVSRSYAWVVFALTFGLLLSDYMSRQVLASVFPLLKADWRLTDTQLGSLGGVVALAVGLLTFPLSLLADRWGRVRSLAIMAVVWSLATLACGIARNFDQMFAARLFVGVGEAAYGSVGVALVLSVFPPSMRATITGAFMAGGVFGAVLGMGVGGAVGAHMGWRWAFMAVAMFGLLLGVLYPIIVRERLVDSRPARPSTEAKLPPFSWARVGELGRDLFGARSAVLSYVGSALQLFTTGAMLAWMPSFLHRYYAMAPDRAAGVSAAFVLVCGVGMIACGAIADRLSLRDGRRKLALAAGYGVASLVLLLGAFALHQGPAQLALMGAGMFFVAGTSGPAGAVTADVTPVSIHGSAFAVLTLVNNLLGLAPGPVAAGMIADRAGLWTALGVVPMAGFLSAACFLIGARFYARDAARRSPG
jgi:MFS family permease